MCNHLQLQLTGFQHHLRLHLSLPTTGFRRHTGSCNGTIWWRTSAPNFENLRRCRVQRGIILSSTIDVATSTARLDRSPTARGNVRFWISPMALQTQDSWASTMHVAITRALSCDCWAHTHLTRSTTGWRRISSSCSYATRSSVWCRRIATGSLAKQATNHRNRKSPNRLSK